LHLKLESKLSARDFDRQIAEVQVRVAILNAFTALGTPITEVAGKVCPGKGHVRPSPDLCNRAPGEHYGEYAKDAAGKPIEKTPDMAAGSICRVNLKTGHTTEIYGPSKGDSPIEPNDIVFDPILFTELCP
jgi:hypothetical protein